MEYTKKLIYQSNYWYNDGLSKAQIHDTSGAISSLRKSLQYNRGNIVARNLLGLVYYARGEVGEALVEWIISKNFKSHENIADYFIKKVQGNPGELETMNNAIKKYNQCLIYCGQNGEDLALIQLKKVVQVHPTFLKAHLLLALLYIRTEQYGKARQVLKRAHKLDTTNEMTLRYMHELSRLNSKKLAKIKEDKEQTVTYKVGNETIIQPAAAGVKDNGLLTTVVNILIGLAIGAATVWFLVVPGLDQAQAAKTNQEIVKYSNQIAAKNAEVSALKKELDGYRSTNDDAKAAQATAESTKESYEALITLKEYWDSEAKSDADMLEQLLKINKESLGEKATKLYQTIYEELAPRVCKKQYKAGTESFDAGNYEEAIQALGKVLALDESYEEGNAMITLLKAYDKAGKEEEYKALYEKAKERYPDAVAKFEEEKAKESEEEGAAEDGASDENNTDTEE